MREEKHAMKGRKFLLYMVLSFGVLPLTAATGQANFFVIPVVKESAPAPTPCANDGYEVLSETGQCWMAFNLGATQVATAIDDEAAYGDLYQWGRPADGHQRRDNPTTTTTELSSTYAPGHRDVITGVASPHDWLLTRNNFLWQGLGGINNPCPYGFRLPTITEWAIEWQAYGGTPLGLFESPLKLTYAGNRHYNGDIAGVGEEGWYWSSSVSNPTVPNAVADVFLFTSTYTDFGAHYRAAAASVRCFKDGTSAVPSPPN